MSENPYQSPGSGPANQSPDLVKATIVGEGDALSTIIPYKNKASLIAYYSGVFSISACVPLAGVIGVVLAIVAVVYGFKGLRYARENPEARGRVHCWIGIIGGFIFGLLGALLQASFIIGLIGAMLDKR